MVYVSLIRNSTFPVWFVKNCIRYGIDDMNKFYLQFLSFFPFTLGAGKIKETTWNQRDGRCMCDIIYMILIHLIFAALEISGTQFNCYRFLLLSHWICSLRNFQQAIWISGPVISMPVPRFTGFLRMNILQPKRR